MHDNPLLGYVHKRSAPDNRATRRADIKLHRRRARSIARDQGCLCHVELVLDPTNGRPVWAEGAETSRRIYIVRHRPGCPMFGVRDPSPYVVVIPPEPGCDR